MHGMLNYLQTIRNQSKSAVDLPSYNNLYPNVAKCLAGILCCAIHPLADLNHGVETHAHALDRTGKLHSYKWTAWDFFYTSDIVISRETGLRGVWFAPYRQGATNSLGKSSEVSRLQDLTGQRHVLYSLTQRSMERGGNLQAPLQPSQWPRGHAHATEMGDVPQSYILF